MAKKRKTPCTPAADYRTGAPREDGWTHDRQALFLMTLAQTGVVSVACKAVEMSEGSAYALRSEARGAIFALGWQAAHLIARDLLEDKMLELALCGVESVVIRSGGMTHRQTLNTGLSMAVLNRLDRRVASLDDREMALVRRVRSDFDGFIDIILLGGHEDALMAFLRRTPDPLHRPHARLMQTQAPDALRAEEAAEAQAEAEVVAEAEAVEAAPEVAPTAPATAPVATGKTPATKRAIDPLLVEESAIFAEAPTPDLAADFAAFAAMARRGGSRAALAA